MRPNKFSTIGLIIAMTAPLVLSLSAQERRAQKRESIIIEHKGDKKEKMVIEIEGDKVTINGKPVDKGDSNMIIRRFKTDEDIVIRAPRRPDMPLPFGSMEPRGGKHFEYRMNTDELKRYSDEMRKRADEMKEKAREMRREADNRAFLGVVTEKADKGAKITEVREESAAAKAGLKAGDIITKVGDKMIDGPETLIEAIRAQKPDDEVKISYRRDGKNNSAKAKLGRMNMADNFDFKFEMPEIDFLQPGKELKIEYLNPWNGNHFDGGLLWYHNRPRLGATIQDTEDDNGVSVIELDAESPALKAGLQKGDIITSINGKKVKNVEEAREALRGDQENRIWKLEILRKGQSQTVEVKVPKELKKTDL